MNEITLIYTLLGISAISASVYIYFWLTTFPYYRALTKKQINGIFISLFVFFLSLTALFCLLHTNM